MVYVCEITNLPFLVTPAKVREGDWVCSCNSAETGVICEHWLE